MDFAELYRKNFPQLTPEEAKELHKAFANYELNPKWFYGSSALEHEQLAQGDILNGLYACFADFDGKADEIKTRTRHPCEGMIVTNTCDNEPDRKWHVAFVPLIPAEEYFKKLNNKSLEVEMRKNVVTSVIVLPGTNDMPSYVGDFSLVCSLTKNLISQLRKSDALKKKATLSDKGYYFLLAKLTLHFMRPEASDVIRDVGPTSG